MKFRFVDKILKVKEGSSIQTIKAISFEEFSLMKYMDRKGAFPETLMLQFAIESASLLIAATSNFTQIGVLKEVVATNFKFSTLPGDRLNGYINILNLTDRLWQCHYTIEAQEKTISDGIFIAKSVDLEDHFFLNDYLLMWREISGVPLPV